MCIYCGTKYYRKIYIKHHGAIPIDALGIRYDIHHVDGDHDNNDPANLIALSLQEHYKVHHSRGDYAACLRLSHRMKLTKEEKTDLARLSSNKRVAEGRHNWQRRDDGTSFSSDLVKAGTHHLLGGAIQRKEVADGRHHLLGGEIQRRTNAKLVSAGTHNFVGPALNKRRLDDGSHQWLKSDFSEKCSERIRERIDAGQGPNDIKKTCEHCKKTLGLPNYKQWHGDNCKFKK